MRLSRLCIVSGSRANRSATTPNASSTALRSHCSHVLRKVNMTCKANEDRCVHFSCLNSRHLDAGFFTRWR